MVSLAVAGQINLTSTLWFGGIWNILSGVMFQVPMCVQPMKGMWMTQNMCDIQAMSLTAGIPNSHCIHCSVKFNDN